MDFTDGPVLASIASLILVLLMDTHQALSQLSRAADYEDAGTDFATYTGRCALGMDMVSQATLQPWRLWSSLTMLDADLGLWVRSRSTSWFSRFLLEEHDDDRWAHMFRMTKRSVFYLANILASEISKSNTNYRLAIPVLVRLACTLFKLIHGESLLICSELFAVERSTVSMMLRDVVNAINDVLKKEISWPAGNTITAVATDFQRLCGLPAVLGAIGGTHIAIAKPRIVDAADYYHFKSGGFAMNCQAVVDSSKRFLDLYVGMPGSTHKARMLRRSTLCHRGQKRLLWEGMPSFDGFSPYLLGDSGYPLLPWLMVPHRRRHGDLPLDHALFNRILREGQVVVENAFGQLKQSFRELLVKSDLHLTFLPDVVVCCAILHNLLLKQSHEEVERLLEVLSREGQHYNVQPVGTATAQTCDMPSAHACQVPERESSLEEGKRKRLKLGALLSLQGI